MTVCDSVADIAHLLKFDLRNPAEPAAQSSMYFRPAPQIVQNMKILLEFDLEK